MKLAWRSLYGRPAAALLHDGHHHPSEKDMKEQAIQGWLAIHEVDPIHAKKTMDEMVKLYPAPPPPVATPPVVLKAMPAPVAAAAVPVEAKHRPMPEVGSIGFLARPATPSATVRRAAARQMGYTGDICGSCGNLTMVQNGTCLKCVTCGTTTGCS